ncbi:hypothetical protein FTO74_02775 [Granulicella sp. WH15]|uniref:hypothetical protein n=1 Tax=Granulicella sp. WH15 TaxID=2602070 RepID=UPI0013671EB9|nr:hypothetical protein [Granulicella sp. WH15]QHN02413.1 hypothetical protein FTO74_02775 [Granulicella sp. WH15]
MPSGIRGSASLHSGKLRWLVALAVLVVVGVLAGIRLRKAAPATAYGPSDPSARREWSIIRRSQLNTMTPIWLIDHCGYPVKNNVREYASEVGTVPRRYMTYPSPDGSTKLVSFLYIEGHWQAPTISEGVEDRYPLATDKDLTHILDMLPCLGR